MHMHISAQDVCTFLILHCSFYCLAAKSCFYTQYNILILVYMYLHMVKKREYKNFLKVVYWFTYGGLSFMDCFITNELHIENACFLFILYIVVQYFIFNN